MSTLSAAEPADFSVRRDEAVAELGDDAIALSVADMDLAAPPAVVEAVASRAQNGSYPYTYLPGSYYDRVQEWMAKRHCWNISTSAITYVPRVVYAVSIAIEELTAPGDGILVHTPSYGPITNLIEPLQRRLVTSALVLSDGRYEIDFNETERLLRSEAKVLLLCSPHNPTGRVWTREELTRLAGLAEKHNALIISDEVHSDLAHAGRTHVPIASLDSQTAQRTLTLTSPAKPFNLAGLEVANLVIENAPLRDQLRTSLVRRGFNNPSYFAAVALEAAYGHSSQWLEALLTHIRENLTVLRDFTAARLPGIALVEPEGTYLAWLDCRRWTPSEQDLKLWMHDARVALSPGSNFGSGYQGFVRINLAVPTRTLRTALDRLGDAYETRSKENHL